MKRLILNSGVVGLHSHRFYGEKEVIQNSYNDKERKDNVFTLLVIVRVLYNLLLSIKPVRM